MLNFFLFDISSSELPVAAIVVALLFMLILLIYFFIYYQYRIRKKILGSLKSEIKNVRKENKGIAAKLVEVERALERKNNFIANATYEMRTPLNAIYGFTELLTDSNLSNLERDDYREMILRNSKSLISIISDISDIINIEKGFLSISKDHIKLNHFMDEVERNLKHEIKLKEKKNLKLKAIKPNTDDEACFFSDHDRLFQIMTNLTGNSLKFTHEGVIEFGYKLIEDNSILFYVSDTGIGIGKEFQKNIFTEFVRIETLANNVKSGFGLGLAISKKLVDFMGGKMWVESVKGSGSTFYFTLPYTPCENIVRKMPFESPEVEDGCWEDKTILIVDDYKDIYLFFTEVLVKTGVNFIYAENGVKAIEACKNHKEIELVLMDIQMPDMTGIEATKRIREFNKKLPIIAQTAYAQSEEIDIFLDAGFNDMITKPIERDTLLRIMKKFLSVN